MSDHQTFLEKVESQLNELFPVIDEMMDNSSIFYRDDNRSSDNFIVIGAPKYHYSKRDEKTQILAREKLTTFISHIELILEHANPNTIQKTKETEKHLLGFISQGRGHVPSSTDSGKQFFRRECSIYQEFLKLFHKQESQLILVPDTNSLIQFSDPASYRKLFNEPFTFLITPTVLSELDKLKINHRNEEFRNKVKSVIKRLKGFRNQGNVLEGVTVDKTITIKMTAVEPDFSKTLKWLDPVNEDDRIIAGILELQVRNPADRLVLVTSDINLQNKAQAAMLNYTDTDDLE